MRETRTVPLAPFQEAFQRSGLSGNELAARLGYWRTVNGKKKADATRAMRQLGLRSESPSSHSNGMKTTIKIEIGTRLARAMDVDPWEVGL